MNISTLDLQAPWIGLSDQDHEERNPSGPISNRETLTGLMYDSEKAFSFILELARSVIRGSATTEPAWLRPVIEDLESLSRLKENWDTYGAPRINDGCIKDALSLLEEVQGDSSPAPSCVPTSEGGIQLEWHRNGVDLEIEISPQGTVEVYFRNPRVPEEWDKSLGGDYTILDGPIQLMSQHPPQS